MRSRRRRFARIRKRERDRNHAIRLAVLENRAHARRAATRARANLRKAWFVFADGRVEEHLADKHARAWAIAAVDHDTSRIERRLFSAVEWAINYETSHTRRRRFLEEPGVTIRVWIFVEPGADQELVERTARRELDKQRVALDELQYKMRPVPLEVADFNRALALLNEAT
jgi:hypothetical protein